MGIGNANLGAARGKIEIDLSDLNNVRVVTRQAGSEAEQNLGRIGAGTRRAESGLNSLGVAARAFGAIIATYATQRTVQLGVELANTAAKVGFMRREMAALASGTDDTSEQMLTAMRAASRGFVSDADLIAAANRALMLGVAKDTDDLTQLLAIATARAGSMGLTVTQAFDDVVRGVGRLSVPILDNLGIIIDANAAYDAYGATIGKTRDQLSQLEKQQAFLAQIMRETQPIMDAQAEAGDSNAAAFERAAAAAENARLALGQLIEDDVVRATNNYAEALKNVVEWLERLREGRAGGRSFGESEMIWATGGAATTQEDLRPRMLNRMRDSVQELRRDLELTEERLQDFLSVGNLTGAAGTRAEIARITEEIRRLNGEIAATDPRIGSRGPPLAPVSVAARAAPAAPRFSKDVLQAQLDWADGVQQIERQAANARLTATEQFERQRSSTIAQFEKSIAREAADFARQRERQAAQHQAAISQIREDGAAREAQWAQDLQARIAGMRETADRRNADAQEDFDERIAKLRADGAERLADMEEDAARQRERAERQHRDNLLNAASRLDARAVAQEMRRFATQGTQQADALQERIDQERENLEERIAQEQATHEKRMRREARDLQLRIDQEQAAHAKRIADARAADAQRIIDMQEAFDEQIAQEDEDRAIRLGRQREDHDDQLAEMDRAQRERIDQINRQAGEQRAEHDRAFEAQMTELGLHNDAWVAAHKKALGDALELWEKFFGDWLTDQEKIAAMAPRPRPPDFPSLLDPNSLPGGSNPAISTSSTNRTTSVRIENGAITVNAAPGQSPTDIADAVDRQLMRRLTEIGAN